MRNDLSEAVMWAATWDCDHGNSSPANETHSWELRKPAMVTGACCWSSVRNMCWASLARIQLCAAGVCASQNEEGRIRKDEPSSPWLASWPCSCIDGG